MITALDSSVLLDFLTAAPGHGTRSTSALRKASAEGALVVSPTVWAEVVGAARNPGVIATSLDRLGIALVPDDRDSATAAGKAYRGYRTAGGTRRRILPDFLIGAHATRHADRLLTRDRGFYRSYFKGLKIMEP